MTIPEQAEIIADEAMRNVMDQMREILAERDITGSELGRLCGMSKQRTYQILARSHAPSLRVVILFALGLGVDWKDLIQVPNTK